MEIDASYEELPSYKHQIKDKQHAWQEATVDDLIPPVYVGNVWDVQKWLEMYDHLTTLVNIWPISVCLQPELKFQLTLCIAFVSQWYATLHAVFLQLQ